MWCREGDCLGRNPHTNETLIPLAAVIVRTVVKGTSFSSIHMRTFFSIVRTDRSYVESVEWEYRAHLTDCYKYLNSVTLSNELFREKWEMEENENLLLLLRVKIKN